MDVCYNFHINTVLNDQTFHFISVIFQIINDPMYNCEVLYYLYKFEIAIDEIEKVNIVTGNTAIFRHIMARASHIVWCYKYLNVYSYQTEFLLSVLSRMEDSHLC